MAQRYLYSQPFQMAYLLVIRYNENVNKPVLLLRMFSLLLLSSSVT